MTQEQEPYFLALDSKINPRNISAWNNKGISLRSIKRFSDALKCFDKTIEIDNNYEWGWHNKGFTLTEMGKIEEALECYNHALEINPNYQSALRNRQRCLKILNLRKKENSLYLKENIDAGEKKYKKKKIKRKRK